MISSVLFIILTLGLLYFLVYLMCKVVITSIIKTVWLLFSRSREQDNP
jgi:hypothetical protein